MCVSLWAGRLQTSRGAVFNYSSEAQPPCCISWASALLSSLSSASALSASQSCIKDHSSCHCHLPATIAPFFFVPCGVNVIELGAFDIPLCSVSQSEGLHAAHGLTMPHVVLFLIWFSYCSSVLCHLSISSRSLMFTLISNIIIVYY